MTMVKKKQIKVNCLSKKENVKHYRKSHNSLPLPRPKSQYNLTLYSIQFGARNRFS